MKMLAEKGIPTHLVEEIDDRRTLVKKVEIVPLEVIVQSCSLISILYHPFILYTSYYLLSGSICYRANCSATRLSLSSTAAVISARILARRWARPGRHRRQRGQEGHHPGQGCRQQPCHQPPDEDAGGKGHPHPPGGGAPSTATVATGMPAGIWTVASRASRPSRKEPFTGMPMTRSSNGTIRKGEGS